MPDHIVSTEGVTIISPYIFSLSTMNHPKIKLGFFMMLIMYIHYMYISLGHLSNSGDLLLLVGVRRPSSVVR